MLRQRFLLRQEPPLVYFDRRYDRSLDIRVLCFLPACTILSFQRGYPMGFRFCDLPIFLELAVLVKMFPQSTCANTFVFARQGLLDGAPLFSRDTFLRCTLSALAHLCC